MSESSKVELGFNKEVRSALAEFVSAKAEIKQAEARLREAEAILRSSLGSAETATIGGSTAFKLVTRNRTDINRTTLKETFPEVFEAVSYSNSYDFIQAIS